MKCLTCPDSTLAIAERSGVEIDYCPSCRGVWLDRGELDKIIERSAEPSWPDDRGRDDDRRRRDDRDRDDRPGPKRRKKGSFLEDLFDF